MINLFLNYYLPSDIQHKYELELCLSYNLNNPQINRICLIGETCDGWSSPHLIHHYLPGQPTFAETFALMNHYHARWNDEHVYNIVANADIYFKEIPFLPCENECFALLRWNVDHHGKAEIFLDPNGYPRTDSQDTWIFKGTVKNTVWADFHMGQPGCDNRLAYELEKAGYTVLNPALSFKTYHLHQSPHRSYQQSVSGPYKHLTPITMERKL